MRRLSAGRKRPRCAPRVAGSPPWPVDPSSIEVQSRPCARRNHRLLLPHVATNVLIARRNARIDTRTILIPDAKHEVRDDIVGHIGPLCDSTADRSLRDAAEFRLRRDDRDRSQRGERLSNADWGGDSGHRGRKERPVARNAAVEVLHVLPLGAIRPGRRQERAQLERHAYVFPKNTGLQGRGSEGDQQLQGDRQRGQLRVRLCVQQVLRGTVSADVLSLLIEIHENGKKRNKTERRRCSKMPRNKKRIVVRYGI